MRFIYKHNFKTMKKIFHLVLLIIACFVYQAKSNTWINISAGYWDNPLIWQGGVSPPCTLSDTIIINHPVAIKQNLLLNSSAYIFIDSAGGICGHHNITVEAGASILKYGILEIDSLIIPGGVVNCSGNGQVILTLYGIISNGGSFSVNGCPLNVGPWFNCVQPAFAFTLNVEEINGDMFTLFPNPFSYSTTLQTQKPLQSATLIICDIIGKEIKRITNINGKEIIIQRDGMKSGMYFYSFMDKSGLIGNGKIIVE